MKIITGLLILINTSYCLAQTYSLEISDREIEHFVQWEILETEKYSEDKKIGPKKLHINTINWYDAIISISGQFGDSIPFWNKFYFLLEDVPVFSEEDIKFLEQQYNSTNDKKWEGTFDGAKITKKFKRRTHSFTVPLFSKDMNYVIFYKYFYCGSLCAHGCTYIYERTDNNSWKLLKKFNCWIS